VDQKTRAAAALTLIRHAVAIDDQDAFDLVAGVIEANKLYYAFADDAGKQIETMDDFLKEIQNEAPGKSHGIVASAAV
jgi:hypothetical protein